MSTSTNPFVGNEARLAEPNINLAASSSSNENNSSFLSVADQDEAADKVGTIKPTLPVKKKVKLSLSQPPSLPPGGDSDKAYDRPKGRTLSLRSRSDGQPDPITGQTRTRPGPKAFRKPRMSEPPPDVAVANQVASAPQPNGAGHRMISPIAKVMRPYSGLGVGTTQKNSTSSGNKFMAAGADFAGLESSTSASPLYGLVLVGTSFSSFIAIICISYFQHPCYHGPHYAIPLGPECRWSLVSGYVAILIIVCLAAIALCFIHFIGLCDYMSWSARRQVAAEIGLILLLTAALVTLTVLVGRQPRVLDRDAGLVSIVTSGLAALLFLTRVFLLSREFRMLRPKPVDPEEALNAIALKMLRTSMKMASKRGSTTSGDSKRRDSGGALSQGQAEMDAILTRARSYNKKERGSKSSATSSIHSHAHLAHHYHQHANHGGGGKGETVASGASGGVTRMLSKKLTKKNSNQQLVANNLNQSPSSKMNMNIAPNSSQNGCLIKTGHDFDHISLVDEVFT